MNEARQVPKKEAKDFAASVGLPWKECSAKTNTNVEEIVLGMVQAIGSKAGVEVSPSNAKFDIAKETEVSDDDADSFRFML